jgi:hypothetical protein
MACLSQDMTSEFTESVSYLRNGATYLILTASLRIQCSEQFSRCIQSCGLQQTAHFKMRDTSERHGGQPAPRADKLVKYSQICAPRDCVISRYGSRDPTLPHTSIQQYKSNSAVQHKTNTETEEKHCKNETFNTQELILVIGPSVLVCILIENQQKHQNDHFIVMSSQTLLHVSAY